MDGSFEASADIASSTSRDLHVKLADLRPALLAEHVMARDLLRRELLRFFSMTSPILKVGMTKIRAVSRSACSW